MLLGELIMPGETVYTPAMPRGGSQAVFSYNVLKLNSGTITVTVQNKNYDEALDTDWVANGAGDSGAAGINMFHREDVKEQIRLKITMSSGSTDWARVFVYDPTWEQ